MERGHAALGPLLEPGDTARVIGFTDLSGFAVNGQTGAVPGFNPRQGVACSTKPASAATRTAT